MFDRCFSWLFDMFQRLKWFIIVLVMLATVIAIANVGRISFDNNIESMLPKNQEVQRIIEFLRESQFSDNVVLSFNLESNEYSTRDLFSVVDQVAQSLEPPLVTDASSGISGIDPAKEIVSFARYVPQLFDKEALVNTRQKTTPDGIQTRLSQIYRQMITPAGTFMKSSVQTDPLGISFQMLNKVKKLSSSLGYDVTFDQGHFVSRDGKHALLFVETPITLTDGFGSRKLITYLKEKLKVLPPYISVDIIAGHLHTVSNEDVIKRDIRLMLAIATVAFFLLFLIVLRDLKAIMIFLVPLASVLVAINLSLLVYKKLSYFIIGMGAVIVGIAIDYGIHVYIAVRAVGGKPEVVKRVAKPVVTGALTTIGVFAAFLFSSVSGYRQLGLFAIISIAICLFYALFILPHFLGNWRGSEIKDKAMYSLSDKHNAFNGIITSVWLVVMILAIVMSSRIVFNNDIKQFDGAEPKITQSEERFNRIWARKDMPAIMVVSGETMEDVLRQNELIYQEIVAKIGEENITSVVGVWPSAQSRVANIERWNTFWQSGQEEKLKNMFREYGSKYNFSEEAFEPFFNNLYADTKEPAFLERLKKKFIFKKQNGYQVLSFFPDKEQYVTKILAMTKNRPDIFLVSRRALSNMISRSISSEALFVLVVAGFFILALTFLLLQNVRLAFIALIPVLSGVLGVLGIFSLFKIPLTVPAIVAGMVVVGLSIDYGIFMVYKHKCKLNVETPKAVAISAVTTLIGAGVLLFSKHPVLFSIGLTMTIGVSLGCITSLIVVPSAYALWVGKEKKSMLQT